MDSSAIYVEIDPQGRIQHYTIDLEDGAEFNYIELHLPVHTPAGQAIEDRLHAQLLANGAEPAEGLEGGKAWGILLDRGRKTLLLYGFGWGWGLPDKALARLILPLLQSRGWQAWRLEHAPLGAWQFARYLQPSQPEPESVGIAAALPPHGFEAYLPQNLLSRNKNLLVSLRHPRWRHYLCISEEGDEEGDHRLGQLLFRGPGVLDEFEVFPDCELPAETAFCCSLLIDPTRSHLAYSFERGFAEHRAYAEAIAQHWPGWQLECLPDTGCHLQQVSDPAEAAWLQLNPLRLQAWMQDRLAGKSPRRFSYRPDQLQPPAGLMLAECFEQMLTHPKQGAMLVEELMALLPELATDRPAGHIAPNPAYHPSADERIKTIVPKSEEVIAAIPRELLILYACLYGYPPWLARPLGWPLTAPPSDAELTIVFDLLARDPGVRWQWLWLTEDFMRHSAMIEQGELLSQWPLHMHQVERAVLMTLRLLKACQRHLQSERELSCLVRILDICHRLALFLKDPTLPTIETIPARQLSHLLMLQDATSRHQLDEAARRQVLELLPELTPAQQHAWRQRAKVWPPAEHRELLRILVRYGGPAQHAQIANTLGKDHAQARDLAADWVTHCSPQEIRERLGTSGSCDLLLKLMAWAPLEIFWPEVLSLIAQENPVLLRELTRQTWPESFCRELLRRRFGSDPAAMAPVLQAEQSPRRLKLWLELSEQTRMDLLFPLLLLQGENLAAHPQALRALASWGRFPDFERLCELLAQPGVEPVAILAHLLAVQSAEQLDVLYLLLPALLHQGREDEAMPLLVQWIQTLPSYTAEQFSLRHAWLRHALELDQNSTSRFYRFWVAADAQLKEPAARRWLLRALSQIHLPHLHQLLWQAYQQEADTELSLIAAFALAQQGQTKVRPALETAGDKLWSYEGLQALHAIKETAWARSVYQDMRQSQAESTPWHPSGTPLPMDLEIQQAQWMWHYD
ncbi:MAG: hypothetical protein CVV27_03815 [Candidatus Melainabacteria bacterium HGW-Melainabacteria-1]|nr:MAG: hypothetical protein CVV27_03815 [Candidatus Melainabacteria bacterium HGW-Melainabacteria-1]